MVNKYLGTNIDIHGGGPDLIFPHHENEISQSECATGEPMSRFWCHIGFINVDNRKMSKSLGNFFTVREAVKQFGYLPIRYFLLSSHYRSPVNFSGEILEQSAAAVERLINCAENLRFRINNSNVRDYLCDEEISSLALLEDKQRHFFDALEDDFNTADAIGSLFEIVKEINIRLNNMEISKQYIEKSNTIFNALCSLLGFTSDGKEDADATYIEQMIEKRAAAKKSRDFAAADAIRDELKEKGIILEDTPQGVKWKRA